MIGQKSIPARFGGIETHVEQLSTRLAACGHDVSVYCRNRFKPDEDEISGANGFEYTPQGGLTYKNVKLLFRPSINTKHLDAASHTFLCAVDSSLGRSFDIVHFHGIGPSAFVPLARGNARAVISTVHALDWRQAKWGPFAKRALQNGEATAVRSSDGVVAVSKILVDYIADRYGVEARHIPNGATLLPPRTPNLIHRLGVEGDDYILAVGRIIPDRGLHYLIEAFNGVDTPLKLVIVGSESPRTEYSAHLEGMADERVIFTGDLYGEVLEELYSNCRLYVLASDVEGLPITVCEAMSFGRCVLLSNIPENAEVGGADSNYFKAGDINSLRSKLKAILKGEIPLAEGGARGRSRIETHYNWDRLAGRLEEYYFEILDHGHR
jgi:glycosyltransferase involved in cell wall biosynthesis